MSNESEVRAEFMAWVQDCGCDTDGAWSAWQAAWNRRTPAQAGAGAVAWMWQHGETGNIGFVLDAPEEELRQWERMNAPRKIVAPLYAAPSAALLEQARQALEAMTFGCEYRSIGGDEPDWHRIQMPSRGALDTARAALSALEAHRKGTQ